MTLTSSQVATLMATIAVVVLSAHAFAHLMARLRQPAVIGEILAGLFLGPTLLGLVAPSVMETLFPSSGPVAAVLAGLAQLGLILLMFVTGSEISLQAPARERPTITLVASVGLLLPFAFGLAAVWAIDYRDLTGPAGSRATTALVFGIAVAVTSIPVISRIMLDLGILRESFARLVLSVAAIEDVVLYAVLAVVLSLAHTPSTSEFGLWALFGVESTVMTVAYHILVTLMFLGGLLLWGTPVLRLLLYGPTSFLSRRSPAAYRLALLLIAVLLCSALGINPIFGALLTGLCARRADVPPDEPAAPATSNAADTAVSTGQSTAVGPAVGPTVGAVDSAAAGAGAWEAIRQFSMAFFIPIYFFSVGLHLDLVRNFDMVFFAWFFTLCCVVKAASVMLGAKLARQSTARSIDLAIALNARGGPGIVLATVTLAAGVVSESFFTSMVVLSVLTSQIAGFWLEHRLPRLRDHAEPAHDPSDVQSRQPVG